jgi:hypothetical protein
MLLHEFYDEVNGQVRISAAQGSRFAKGVAGDFNPIHDENARRFCVPGDLLFAITLQRIGLYQHMTFRFHLMIGDGVLLTFASPSDGVIEVKDEQGRVCLSGTFRGDKTDDPRLIEPFMKNYVAFSGSNFPYFMKPLMEESGVMFHPQRPLVIYESMAFDLARLPDETTELSYERGIMDVNSKRADLHLKFRMHSNGETVGAGSKKLVVSGLRPYDPVIMDGVVDQFHALQRAFQDQRR